MLRKRTELTNRATEIAQRQTELSHSKFELTERQSGLTPQQVDRQKVEGAAGVVLHPTKLADALHTVRSPLTTEKHILTDRSIIFANYLMKKLNTAKRFL